MPMKHLIITVSILTVLLHGCSNDRHARESLPPELEQACDMLFKNYVFLAEAAKMIERKPEYKLNETWQLASNGATEIFKRAEIMGCRTDIWASAMRW